MKPFILILSLLSIGLIGFTEQSVSFVIFYFFLSTIPLFFFNQNEKLYYSLIFIVNVLVSYFIYKYYISHFGAPYFAGGSDDLRYENDAQLFVERFNIFEYSKIRGGVVAEYHNSVGYIYIVSLIIEVSNYFGGYHTLLPRIINAALLAGTSIMLFRTLKGVSFIRYHSLVILIVGLSPLQMFISGHVFRDILTEFLLVAIFYLGVRERTNFFQMAIIVACLLLLWELRNFSAMIGCFLYAIVKYYNLQKYSKKLINKKVYKFVFLFIGITLLAIVAPILLMRFNTYFEGYSDYRGEEMSDGFASIIFSAPLLPFGVFVRILYLLITPLPIFTSNMAVNLMQFESIIRILLLPHFFYGLKKALSDEKFEKYYLYIFLVPFIIISLTSFQVRQFTMFYPFYIIILVYGIEMSRRNLKFTQLTVFSGLFFVSVSLFYFLIS